MSGRIGIILASTVSRVIEVPATHSSGVEWTWPASTVAISSSAVAKIVRPARRSRASFGETRTPGSRTRRRSRQPTTTATAVMPARVAAGPPARASMRASRARSPLRSPTLTSARSAAAWGEPSGGIRRNGTRKLPVMAPTVLTARKRAGAPAGVLADPAAAAWSCRERQAEHDRRQQHDRDATSAIEGADGVEGLARVRVGRVAMNATRPNRTSAPTSTWLAARKRAGFAIRGRMRVNSSAPIARPGEEQGEDDREDVRGVARARGEQPGPQDLVAERGQARDEGDGEREAGPAGSIGRVPARSRCQRGADADCAGRDAPRAPATGRSRPRSPSRPAPTASAPVSPNSSISTNPATRVPTIAPRCSPRRACRTPAQLTLRVR